MDSSEFGQSESVELGQARVRVGEGVQPHSRHCQANILWLAEDMALAESGAPYGPGLEAFGLLPSIC